MKHYNVPFKDRYGLIDGDIIVYSSAFAAMKENYNHLDTLLLLEEMLMTIKNTLNLNDATIFLSDTTANNFRSKVAKTVPYKGNRKSEKPKYYQEIREHLFKNWDAVLSVGMEADDYMGLHQTDKTIICTTDKDLDQIVGWHYNWKQMKTYYVNEEDAIHYFYLQMLMGDSSDNIKGIPRIGPVKALRALDGLTPSEMELKVREMYYDAFTNNEERYEENLQLLMIKGMPLDVTPKMVPKSA